MLPKNDNILIGLVAGLIVPFIAYAVLLQVEEWLSGGAQSSGIFTPRTLALVSIGLNGLVVNVFRRRFYNKAIQGLVFVTITLAIVWFVRFGKELL